MTVFLGGFFFCATDRNTYVDGDNAATENGNPDTHVEVRPPVANDKSSSGQVGRGGHDILEKVIPTSRVTDERRISTSDIPPLILPIDFSQKKKVESHNIPKSRINHSTGITTETLVHGNKSSHLSQACHDKEDGGTDHNVGNEHGAGPSPGQTGSGADDETGTDGAGDGEHHDVPRLHVALEFGIFVVGGGAVDRAAFVGRAGMEISTLLLLDVYRVSHGAFLFGRMTGSPLSSMIDWVQENQDCEDKGCIKERVALAELWHGEKNQGTKKSENPQSQREGLGQLGF